MVGSPLDLSFGVERTQEKNLPPLMKMGNSDPFFLEQFKGLRAKLESRFDADGIKVVAVTSAIAGEGKTLSSANLAINFALGGRKKVLLVDGDFRKPELAEGLSVSSNRGIMEYLHNTRDIHDIVQRTYIPGMYFMGSGKSVSNPSSFLASEKFRSLIRKVRDHFDLVVLDTAPILPVADTLSFCDLVDGFIFVFRVQKTPHTMLKKALEEMGNSNILGVVLNGLTPQSHHYYNKYYGKYYHKQINI